jgi:hypothetical protein
VVLDPLNGENSIKGYDLLRPCGRIVHYGAASITTESRSLFTALKGWWKCLTVNSLDIMSQNKSISGYHLGYLISNKAFQTQLQEDLRVLLSLYEQNKISIKVDSTFGFSKIGEAMKRMHTRQNVGKIILKPDSELEEVEKEQLVKQQVKEQEEQQTPAPVEQQKPQVEEEQPKPQEEQPQESQEVQPSEEPVVISSEHVEILTTSETEEQESAQN